MGLFLLNGRDGRDFVVPAEPILEERHAPNFQRFDGMNGPEDNYDAHPPIMGLNYYPSPRPGATNSPLEDIVYTPGPHYGITGTVGGQPLPVACWQANDGASPDSIRAYTQGKTFRSPQFRLGALGQGGQRNPGYVQTLQLSEITNNPPQPGDISSIIAGF